MKPFMRPTDRARLAPVGWVAEPAGQWAGREVEVVYDPRRHDVVLVRGDATDAARSAIGGGGYRRIAVEDSQEMWVRDRVGVAQVRFEALGHGHQIQHSVEVAAEPQ